MAYKPPIPPEPGPRPGLDEALAAYRRAIAADPQERDAQPLYHAGQILMYQGQYQEAEALGRWGWDGGWGGGGVGVGVVVGMGWLGWC